MRFFVAILVGLPLAWLICDDDRPDDATGLVIRYCLCFAAIGVTGAALMLWGA